MAGYTRMVTPLWLPVFQRLLTLLPNAFLCQMLRGPLAWPWLNLIGLWCTTAYFFVRAELAAAYPKLPSSHEARFLQLATVPAMIAAALFSTSFLESLFTVSLFGFISTASILASVAASLIVLIVAASFMGTVKLARYCNSRLRLPTMAEYERCPDGGA